jgi:hypothetical protein
VFGEQIIYPHSLGTGHHPIPCSDGGKLARVSL